MAAVRIVLQGTDGLGWTRFTATAPQGGAVVMQGTCIARACCQPALYATSLAYDCRCWPEPGMVLLWFSCPRVGSGVSAFICCGSGFQSKLLRRQMALVLYVIHVQDSCDGQLVLSQNKQTMHNCLCGVSYLQLSYMQLLYMQLSYMRCICQHWRDRHACCNAAGGLLPMRSGCWSVCQALCAASMGGCGCNHRLSFHCSARLARDCVSCKTVQLHACHASEPHAGQDHV
jgi:hypothetical protein